ncbi:LD-carboxypeptidase [Kitasatospora saccharophila]|uniref:LD-carboxypeptidase n=1 Tax=Kitasatospora saccharophila TaxID=407973 RepID=A0ABP5IY82_9ACTN
MTSGIPRQVIRPPVLPPALRSGDTIGIVSPSSPGASVLTDEVARGTRALEKLGFQVRFLPNALGRHGWTAAPVAARIADLHAAFVDPTIHAVLYSLGGLHSAQVLDGLDMEVIATNPKILCGYSDATSLLSAVHEHTGLITFYGPALIPQFGELPEPYPETSAHFLRVTTEASAAGPCPRIPYTVTDLDFGRREREQRPRDRSVAPPRRVLQPGSATGPAVVACLPSLRDLVGTPWQPATAGRVLFLETTEPPYSAAAADADLWHLRNAGMLEGVAAVVLGRTIGWDPAEVEGFVTAIRECLDSPGIPLLADFEFGHANPILTIPNGILVQVAGDEVSILQPAVSPRAL